MAIEDKSGYIKVNQPFTYSVVLADYIKLSWWLGILCGIAVFLFPLAIIISSVIKRRIEFLSINVDPNGKFKLVKLFRITK